MNPKVGLEMSTPKNQVVQTNTGIKAKGDMREVADFTEEMKDALEKVSEDEESVEDFDYWRPEEGDDEKEIKNRTVSLESISRRKLEEGSDKTSERDSDPNEEFEGKNRKLDRSKKGEMILGLVEIHKKLLKPIVSGSLRFIRGTEELIYRFMMNFNPYYFNSKKFSVSLEKDDDQFEIAFNSPEKDYRRTMRQNFDVVE